MTVYYRLFFYLVLASGSTHGYFLSGITLPFPTPREIWKHYNTIPAETLGKTFNTLMHEPVTNQQLKYEQDEEQIKEISFHDSAVKGLSAVCFSSTW